MTLSEFDNEIRKDHNVVCGCDEAGRGPLAGDVFAAAVIFDKDTVIEGINDSKKLTAKKREELFDEIMEKAVDFSIQTATVEEIEDINILNAAMLAMKRAVEDMDTKPDVCLIDGNKTPEGLECPAIAVVKGDAKVRQWRRLQFLQRSQGTGIWSKWLNNILSIGLRSIRAMAQSSTIR